MASTFSWFVIPPLLLTGGCAGGGGGGGGGAPIAPPIGPTAFNRQAGIDSVAPGPGELRVDFTPPPSTAFEVAVFTSTDRSTLFAGSPHVPAAGATTLTLGGLPNGVRLFVGLGIRPATGGTYQQTGPSVTATPGTPLFVDPTAVSGSGDGTIGSPYSLFEGVLQAFALLLAAPTSSVNLWLREGTYRITSTLPVAAGVCLYGGFGPAFDLATRDVTATPSICNVLAGQAGAFCSDQVPGGNGLPVIIDGVRFAGNNSGARGIDLDDTLSCPLELHSVIVTDMTDRGARIRNSQNNAFDVVVINSQLSRNGADGLNGSGNFDYTIFNSIFASNVQEGLDLNDLTPDDAGVARLTATSSQFFGNGAEGLDCTLGLPLTPTTGAYEISVRGCSFERNVSSGCLIDGDFELASGYSADVLVRECSSRANGAHGFHLDLDGPLDATQSLTTFVYGVRATGNVLDGIYITSESRAGIVGVSTSAMVGNMGVGLRLEGPPATPGNRAALVSHCLFASNFAGGMISRDIPASAVSSIAYQQASAFDANTVTVSNVGTSDPAAIAFANAPEEYLLVSARSGAVLTCVSAPTFGVSANLELADDGTERGAASIAGTQVTLSAAPDDFAVPGLLSAFAPQATGVDESYDLLPGSVAIGAGMNGADAGPSGSTTPGTPGITEEIPPLLFYPVKTSPEISQLVGAGQSLEIDFSKTLLASSVNASTVRARRGGSSINLTLSTSGARLTISPASGNWGAGDFRIELDGVQGRNAGEPASTILTSPLVLPFSR